MDRPEAGQLAAVLRMEAHEPPSASPDGTWLAAAAARLSAAARPRSHGLGEDALVRLLCIVHRNTHTLYSGAGEAGEEEAGEQRAIQLARPVGTGLYLLGSAFNHSCRPSAAFSNVGRALEVRALRSIAAGEEVTVSYVDAGLPLAQRRQLLMEQFCFECRCEKCAAEERGEEAAAIVGRGLVP